MFVQSAVEGAHTSPVRWSKLMGTSAAGGDLNPIVYIKMALFPPQNYSGLPVAQSSKKPNESRLESSKGRIENKQEVKETVTSS